ncbi:MAG: hypothetical protein K9K67_10405 [Bacteriovoracaceae bacterium]|nr:hypothetical protein [Bacteriovoracaceae bacterium]
MSNFTMDLNSLAQETLELSENLRKEFSREESQRDLFALHQIDAFDFSATFEPEEVSLDQEIEECQDIEVGQEDLSGPGLIYRIEKGISTFCIRGIVSEDLEWDIEALEKENPEIMKALKIREEADLETVGFFSTTDQAMAETLFDHLINRRFPRQEAILCNLSDPGFSWWMDCDPKSIKVYFQSHGIERDDSLIQLGPLGDPLIAFRRLSRALGLLRNYFPVNEYSATDKSFMLSTTNESQENFAAFQNIFLKGEFPFEDFLAELKGEELTLFLYLREIAILRRFWLKISDYVGA